MKTPIIFSKENFNPEALKGYSKEQFIEEFSKAYPNGDPISLAKVADELGLVSGPTGEKPAAALSSSLSASSGSALEPPTDDVKEAGRPKKNQDK